MRTPKKKYYVVGIAAVLVVVAGYLIFGGRRQEGPTYQSITPRVGSIETSISATGTVLPKNRLEIKPPVAGRIEQIMVREGQMVRKGQVLALMSSTERSALIDAARIEGGGSLAYWEKVYRPIPILTPIAGEVIVRNVEPGQAAVTTTAILVISDRLVVDALVDETDIGRVAEGQESLITLDAHPEVQVEGRVEHISYESTTSNNVTVYTVEIQPLHVPKLFRSGMTANVRIVDKRKEDILLLPAKAVTMKDGRSYVRVPATGGEPRMKEITTGISDDSSVEVVSGLGLKDRVLIASMDKIVVPTESSNPFMPFPRRGAKKVSGSR
ncbi:MAG: HlyD family efflux transporter periplasmic adaptor subunit [Spirochaetes bacterium]|nr:HlyD family efflux transporter periplasmic adaptor subunit [Spirochaetota bacterium]